MRRPAPKRKAPDPDVRYHSRLVAKFINYIMWDGEKAKAMKIVYQAFDLIKEAGRDPLATFEQAVKNAMPTVEVRSRRVGGANYQVPREVRPERAQALALRWIREAARASRTNQPFYKVLAQEIMASADGEGAAVRKKEEVHRMAEANRAFAHLAW